MTQETKHTAVGTGADVLRALHHGRAAGDPLVLPGPWDAASARVFADAGFPALATPSAGISASLGYEDGEGTPPDEMFGAIRRIARAVDVPVTADVEAGYGLPAAELVERLLEAGAAGCNLEDTDPATGALVEPARQADRLAAVRAAAGSALVLNARVDTYLRGERTPAAAVERGLLYAAAGADCVYPILAPTTHLTTIAEALAVPVNALCRPGTPSPWELGALGVTRVTFGGTLHTEALESVRSIASALTR
ncbi:isocitrate lyase/phosphoenolpyruvate mutase family protein [Streptomyces cocklensis]|uniref:2-Methylisocitrate lyase, PEP mutase family n=1 Tax=Actinacidiphila cocklensis TaxID=887465 RepID=A0A9W4EAR0_9ACTN|nr:isocitrate lyase/phosphoenolpyruvate mutase family protein [Actinacidiphila cocklensis]MDD1058335.1 isocitrate lyase/phosphoenolpyruvate mutase family protein [Actinacidiphila cocklensis]WSX79266.1 isocitrate lyase/phosphoenolpyruvate mutase family protein [Streptomyces sp. NBC_00899]CAG6397563.1 2-Methylisocitrate lyase, PEP mutase family [Actinacidiphila cocklensis]